MKKPTALTLILAIILSGCINEENPKEDATTPTTTTTTTTTPTSTTPEATTTTTANPTDNTQFTITANIYTDEEEETALTTRNYDKIYPDNPDNPKTTTLTKTRNGYYHGLNLALYTHHKTEKITCTIKEYYDNSLHREFTAKIYDHLHINNPYTTGYITTLLYGEHIKPQKVEYHYTCRGIKSKNKYSGTYTLNIKYR